jgi:hypothetical protein
MLPKSQTACELMQKAVPGTARGKLLQASLGTLVSLRANNKRGRLTGARPRKITHLWNPSMPSSRRLVACNAWLAQDTASSRGPVALFVLSITALCTRSASSLVSIASSPAERSGDGTHAGAMQVYESRLGRGLCCSVQRYEYIPRMHGSMNFETKRHGSRQTDQPNNAGLQTHPRRTESRRSIRVLIPKNIPIGEFSISLCTQTVVTDPHSAEASDSEPRRRNDKSRA